MSTTIALYAHKLITACSNNCDTDVVYLYYHKAFDLVPHNELLLKLWKYGITGNLWSWFKAYLTACRQCVRVCNQVFEYLSLISGVPQGSLLGPLLYIFYTNNMFTLITVTRPLPLLMTQTFSIIPSSPLLLQQNCKIVEYTIVY